MPSPTDPNTKASHLWRSKFRDRAHDLAHEEVEPTGAPRSTHPLVTHDKPHLVQTQAELVELIGELRSAGSFAFDSEFIGELYYIPKLCLLQIATSQKITLVDPLAELDLMPLWDLMCDPAVEKIVHAGGQDMEPALRATGRPAANVVDTQIAAAFGRLVYPVSLQRLVLQLLDVRLGKGLTFTQWDARPLSAQQLRYGADDVRYLPAAWSVLKERLESAGTLSWMQQESDAMCLASPYQFDPQTSLYKVRGAGSLDNKQLGMLRELTIWRDGAARQADLPPRTFLKDEILVDLCRRAPRDQEKLQNINGLPRPVRAAHSEAILQAISQGASNPITDANESRKVEELPEAQFRTDEVVCQAQQICYTRGIDPQMVFSRADVAELLRRVSRGRDTADLRIMQGWRGEVAGGPIVALLKG